ncbi:hypothetical protein ACLIIZ_13740 [Azonexus caeni]|uniref:hypothetical protein n=1 Tax=Azonexus caeni TaxID=266126 RepID=UPI003A8A324A
MIVTACNPYTAAWPTGKITGAERQTSVASPATLADKLSISSAARALLAGESSANDAGIEARLKQIKSKPAAERSAADTEYLLANDKRLAEIRAKDPQTLTADEVDYQQKAGGFVNTMTNLSSAEKALYDEMVAAGNYAAVEGMNLIALARQGMDGQQVTLPDGSSFDPTTTEITPENIRKLFTAMFVDSDGSSAKRLAALAGYLEQRSASA